MQNDSSNGGHREYHVGDRNGFLEIMGFDLEDGHYKKKRKRARCLCRKCGRQDYLILPSNFKKQKSCGCDRTWTVPPSGNKSKLFKGIGDMPSMYLVQIKGRAAAKGFECNLDLQFLWDLFVAQKRRCKLSGVPIHFGGARRAGSTASVDRIDSRRGYTRDNVQWVHKEVNLMKMYLDQSEFLNWCHLISQCQSSKPLPLECQSDILAA